MIELDHIDYIPRDDLIDKDPFAGLVALYERTGVVDTDDFLELREWMQDTGIPVALNFRRRGEKVTGLTIRTRDQEDADAFIARWL